MSNEVILNLLKQANNQLAAQNNELGGADRPTPGPSSISALEAPIKAGISGLGGIMSIPKELMDASARDVYNLGDHTQPKESVGPAFEAASLLAGGGMPMAEAGAAGIFGGKLAKTADLRALNEAQQMVAGGKLPDEVLHATGWFRGPADHRWRFEIPDNNLRLNYMPTGEGDMAKAVSGQMLSHPELYKAYPDLQSLGVYVTKDSRVPTGTGMFMGRTGTMEINAPNQKVARSVAAHELQHGVQGIEGFSFGADPSQIAGLIEKGLRKNPELLQGNKFMDVVEQARPIYQGTAGEVEARNVQHRLDWSPQSRRGIPPWYSQDTPYSAQFHADPNTGLIKALRGQ